MTSLPQIDPMGQTPSGGWFIMTPEAEEHTNEIQVTELKSM